MRPMKPPAFEYHRPDTAADAVAMLAQLGDESKILAGGQSLVPMLALRLTMFEHLIDITRIAELQGIERDGATLQIGAGTTEADIETSSEVAAAVPLLARATPLIGHFQIRNRGTIGGSIAHADPAAEYPAVALALDATLEVLGTAGARTVPATDFFTGLWDTTIDDDELLTGVSFPVWAGRCGFAIEEVARRHGDFAIAGAAVALEVDAPTRSCAAGSACSAWARRRCGRRRPRPRSSAARRRDRRRGARTVGGQRPRRRSERPALATGVPPASRCGDGDESVAFGDVGGPWWLRSRRP